MNNHNNNGFHALTIKYQGITHQIKTDVEISVAYDPANPPSPLPTRIAVPAIWDTGASSSVVTKATASALGLIPVGVITLNHAGGSGNCNTYMVNFLLPNSVGFKGVRVCECENIQGNFGALIGMDIICSGDFSITNVNNLTTMSFRIPSIATVDYVIDAKKTQYVGVRSNDPCPCGKKDRRGRPIKFKDCHRREFE